ncbi:MAG: Rid family detoxifying hydrolase [Candidatus Marinimicrobia bacterium]|nr:Rid family detoxifying hydrolase [Candidatus Neomarinimicrobiota bacterium]MDP6789833.1 Rid family detoxifying hydrolase [Candidatus Neomarinimicrobiota bacterium]
MTDPKVISTPDAPAAIGPYSQAKVANGFVFTAGQVPIDPATNTLIEGDFGEQVLLVLKNINAILKAAGTDAGRAVKFTVFLKDFSNYAVLNEVFTEFFSGTEPPARSALQVSKLPLDAEVEIECIAAL